MLMLRNYIHSIITKPRHKPSKVTILPSRRQRGKMASHPFMFSLFLVAVSVLPLHNASAQDNPDQTFTLNLKNVDIHSLIETVSTRTGRNFIVDPRVNGTVNVISSEPLNASKLYELFLSVLEVQGYAAVEAGPLTKIVPSLVATQSSTPVLSEDSNVADDMVSEVIHLNRINALEVVEVLRPLFPESASISAESTGNTIVITDRAANIEKLIELIKSMDSQ